MQMFQWLNKWLFADPQVWGFIGLMMIIVGLWHVFVLWEKYEKERDNEY